MELTQAQTVQLCEWWSSKLDLGITQLVNSRFLQGPASVPVQAPVPPPSTSVGAPVGPIRFGMEGQVEQFNALGAAIGLNLVNAMGSIVNPLLEEQHKKFTIEREAQEKMERERREADRVERAAERVAQEKMERERREVERIERVAKREAQEQMEREKREAERIERVAKREAQEQIEREKREAERVERAAKREAQEQMEREKREAERAKDERDRAERIAKEEREKAERDADRAERERATERFHAIVLDLVTGTSARRTGL
jgi:hypothetical protein